MDSIDIQNFLGMIGVNTDINVCNKFIESIKGINNMIKYLLFNNIVLVIFIDLLEV